MSPRFALLLLLLLRVPLLAEDEVARALPVAPSPPAAAPAAKPEADPLAGVPMDKVSYYIGRYVFGRQMATQGYTPDFEALKKGFKDAFDNHDAPYSMDEMKAAMTQFSAGLRVAETQRRAKLAAAGAAAAKEATEFLAKNAERAGVKQTDSGLQYEVLATADGPKPQLQDFVTVNYKGTFIDGTVFDSTSGKPPATFAVTSVIKGWTEGLQLMPKGSKFKFFIPAPLAYGDRGESRAHIAPHQALIFEVELIDIKPGPAPEPAPKPKKKTDEDEEK